jgi:hypothetical protein
VRVTASSSKTHGTSLAVNLEVMISSYPAKLGAYKRSCSYIIEAMDDTTEVR